MEVDETGPIGGVRAALSGAMFWIVTCTSGTEDVDADRRPDFSAGPLSKLRQLGGAYFVASFRLCG